MVVQTPSVKDYRVGWICAVQVEYVVACELLDQEFPAPPLPPNDTNVYTFGRVGVHNVVVACLPKGKYGLSSATSVAINMLRTFNNLSIRLMVGIGGGAPSAKHDIRLGDVVVSVPSGRSAGVIHYEYGKAIQGLRFERTGALDGPPPVLLTAVQKLAAQYERRGHRIRQIVNSMIYKNPRLKDKYQDPGYRNDVLIQWYLTHKPGVHENDCAGPPGAVVRRPERAVQDSPVIHYGLIASADRLMKDALARDWLAETEDVLCFEMEAAGLMDHFRCLVIRGICDYSDTHKNDVWQGYAAATAAAYAKELLGIIGAGVEPDTICKDFAAIAIDRDPSSTSAAVDLPVGASNINSDKLLPPPDLDEPVNPLTLTPHVSPNHNAVNSILIGVGSCWEWHEALIRMNHILPEDLSQNSSGESRDHDKYRGFNATARAVRDG